MMDALIISDDFSKKGGIELLSELVCKAVREHYNVKKIPQKTNNKFSRVFKELKTIHALRGAGFVIFMHSFLYRRYKKYIPKKTKVIVWAHGIEVWGEWGRQKNPNFHSADKIIAVSSFTAEKVYENWPSANVSIINNGIELWEPSKDAARSNEILLISRLDSTERYKGHELVFEALSILKRINNESVPIFNVVGEGDDKKRLAEVAKSLGVSDYVIFHDYVVEAELAQIISRCFAFVMPSFVIKQSAGIWGGEGFGLVYLEAGLHKLPVIACNEGGQTDCVIDGETGFLVNPNAEEIADKMDLLMKNPGLAQEMGKAGYRHVTNNFSFEIFEKNVVNTIQEVLT